MAVIFKKTPRDGIDSTEVTFEIKNVEATLDELIEGFEYFLKAIGYFLPGPIKIEEELFDSELALLQVMNGTNVSDDKLGS